MKMRFVAAILIIVALTGCKESPSSKSERALSSASTANASARESLDLIGDLTSQVDRLSGRVADLEKLLMATDASLTEARGNHTSLRNTFNENVEKSNKRDEAQERDIDWLMRRNGIYR